MYSQERHSCPVPRESGQDLSPIYFSGLPEMAYGPICVLHLTVGATHQAVFSTGDPLWAPSVLPHASLSAWSPHPQPHLGRKMESKVSEGGLNVTLTIRLLMHGKVGLSAAVLRGAPVLAATWLGAHTQAQPSRNQAFDLEPVPL